MTPAPTVASECPSGWREYSGYCWNITAESYKWSECEDACSPGWPACILDEDVNLWLAELAFTQQAPSAWIGASDAKTEGVWEWTASCPYVSTFTAWSPNEPNNIGIGGEQDCATIWSSFYGGTQHNNPTTRPPRPKPTHTHSCQFIAVCDGPPTPFRVCRLGR